MTLFLPTKTSVFHSQPDIRRMVNNNSIDWTTRMKLFISSCSLFFWPPGGAKQNGVETHFWNRSFINDRGSVRSISGCSDLLKGFHQTAFWGQSGLLRPQTSSFKLLWPADLYSYFNVFFHVIWRKHCFRFDIVKSAHRHINTQNFILVT